MSLRYHETAETSHRILNPFTDEKLMTLGAVCRLRPGQRLLDLACGKGELLSRWAQHFGTRGLGIDLSEVFLAAARARAAELGVTDLVTFELNDAGTAKLEAGAFDLVSCIGASWIGGGLQGTVELMRPAVRAGGPVLIGDCYCLTEPPPAAYRALRIRVNECTSLLGTYERLFASGVELVEMVLADRDSWDRYVAAQWWTLGEWLRTNPNSPDAPGLQASLESSRRSYLEYGRQ